MSLNNIPLDLILFIIASAVGVVSAALVISHRSLIYSAFFLSIVGMCNAILFTLLGYTIIALFHLAVYVGAAVTFIMFSITMFKEVPPVELPVRYLGLLASILLAVTVGYIFCRSPIAMKSPIASISYRDLAIAFLDPYRFPIIIATIALITTLIEAITLARREVEG